MKMPTLKACIYATLLHTSHSAAVNLVICFFSLLHNSKDCAWFDPIVTSSDAWRGVEWVTVRVRVTVSVRLRVSGVEWVGT